MATVEGLLHFPATIYVWVYLNLSQEGGKMRRRVPYSGSGYLEHMFTVALH